MKRATLLLLFACAWTLSAHAETIRGVVRNGTTNKPSAGDEVILKRIGNGMEDVAKTRSNAKGEFSFDVAGAPQQAYLLWVKHQEVTYTHVATPGSGPATVLVFDSAANVNGISVSDHMIVLQTTPPGDTLHVDELYTVSNQSSPPRTRNGQHTLDVYLPEGAKIEETMAQPAGNMALKTPLVPDPSAKNKFFFGFPIRPGRTQFRATYNLPYNGKQVLDPRTSLETNNLMVAAPSSMNFVPADGSVYSPTTDPQIQGVTMYVAKGLNPGQKLGFQVEGTGVIPKQGEEQQAAGGRPAGREGPGGGMAPPNDRPDPLHSGQWLFLGVLSLFLAAGAIYVYASGPQEAATPAKGKSKSKSRSDLLLEAMKEEVFQLESDRLQGKITTQEYDAAKAALDKTLQRAVKRQPAAK